MRLPMMTLCLAAAFAVTGCSREAAPAGAASAPEGRADPVAAVVEHDPFSYAEPARVRIEDLALELAMDFDARTLSGSATYTLDWRDESARELVLDTRDLAIDKVVGERGDGKWQDLEYSLAEADPRLGSKLTIQAPDRNPRIRVNYTTSPEASGLQWLTPAMTDGGEQPFMFSQSQQIHARSWVPLQDTPQVRFTYTAHVTSPDDVMVLMSADNDPEAERDGDYRFEMPQPIPSYLLAIAAGDLVFEPISERAGVWAEPGMVEAAVEEFADTEKMIQVTEELYGPYQWGRYDLLILPPSFPYGGMENPRLSFITPTVIVGDKSLVSLIAHELAHSWSGNLVTFATPKDQWLNEGITSYVENRIVEELYGRDFAVMEAAIAQNDLRASLDSMDPQAQALAIRPEVEVDANSTYTAVAYDKGAWFLMFLEQRFGREAFDAFLRKYFDDFAFQSVTTQTFFDYASEHLLGANPGKVTEAELEQWLYEPGIPDSAPVSASTQFDQVDALRQAWLDGEGLPAKDATDAWSTQEWLHFLDGMPPTLEQAQLAELDRAYEFTGTANGEIAMRWYPLAVRSGYDQANGEIEEFLEEIGRRKLIMPTYAELVKTPEGLAIAERVLEKARPGYHPITTASVERVIAEAKGETAAPVAE